MFSKYQEGFSLVEVVVGVMVTSIAAGAIMFGIAEARLNLASVHLRERAYEELTMYSDYWKSQIMTGGVAQTGNGPNNGTDIVLTKTLNNLPLDRGRLFRRIVKSSNSGSHSEYYNVNTWIKWEDRAHGSNKTQTLEFNLKQLKFN
mgnify:CR=1 FL=1